MPRPTKTGIRYTAEDWRLIEGSQAFAAVAVGVVVDAINKSLRDGTPIIRDVRAQIAELRDGSGAPSLLKLVDQVEAMLDGPVLADRLNATAGDPQAAALLMHVLAGLQGLHRYWAESVAPKGASEYGPGAPRRRRTRPTGRKKIGRPPNPMADEIAKVLTADEASEPSPKPPVVTQAFIKAYLAERRVSHLEAHIKSIAAQVRYRLTRSKSTNLT